MEIKHASFKSKQYKVIWNKLFGGYMILRLEDNAATDIMPDYRGFINLKKTSKQKPVFDDVCSQYKFYQE